MNITAPWCSGAILNTELEIQSHSFRRFSAIMSSLIHVSISPDHSSPPLVLGGTGNTVHVILQRHLDSRTLSFLPLSFPLLTAGPFLALLQSRGGGAGGAGGGHCVGGGYSWNAFNRWKAVRPLRHSVCQYIKKSHWCLLTEYVDVPLKPCR